MLRNTISIPGPLPRRTPERFHPEQLLEATPHSPSASHQQNSGKSRLYLYWDERRDIRWNIAWARGQSRRNFLRAQAIFHSVSRLESQYSYSQLQFPHYPSGESNIERVDSPYCSSIWGFIFQYIPSSTWSILWKYSPSSTGSIFYSTLPVELDDYWKILPCWLNNAGGLSFNIIMYIIENWLGWSLGTDRQTHQGFIDWTSIVQGYTIMGKK